MTTKNKKEKLKYNLPFVGTVSDYHEITYLQDMLEGIFPNLVFEELDHEKYNTFANSVLIYFGEKPSDKEILDLIKKNND